RTAEAPSDALAPTAGPVGPSGARTPQPDHSGLGELLPHGGILQDVPEIGQMDAPPCWSLRPTHPSHEVEGLAVTQVLGPLETSTERFLGGWRQAHGTVPAEVLLVPHRAPHPDTRYGFARRPQSAGVLVGPAESQHPPLDPQ